MKPRDADEGDQDEPEDRAAGDEEHRHPDGGQQRGLTVIGLHRQHAGAESKSPVAIAAPGNRGLRAPSASIQAATTMKPGLAVPTAAPTGAEGEPALRTVDLRREEKRADEQEKRDAKTTGPRRRACNGVSIDDAEHHRNRRARGNSSGASENETRLRCQGAPRRRAPPRKPSTTPMTRISAATMTATHDRPTTTTARRPSRRAGSSPSCGLSVDFSTLFASLRNTSPRSSKFGTGHRTRRPATGERLARRGPLAPRLALARAAAVGEIPALDAGRRARKLASKSAPRRRSDRRRALCSSADGATRLPPSFALPPAIQKMSE